MAPITRRRRRAAALVLLGAVAVLIPITVALAATSSRVARISTEDPVVTFGSTATVAGGVSGSDGGVTVALKYRHDGSDTWHTAREVHTDRHGRYRARVAPRRTAAWRAFPRRGSSADRERIRVRARTRFHTSAHHVRRGRSVRLHGRVRPGGKRAIRVLVRGAARAALQTRTDAAGRYSVRWAPPRHGRYRLRAVSARNGRALGAWGPPRRVTAYRPAHASWYGPGFYGNRTACGQTLTTTTLGVAHKTLPCGTRLTLRYRGRSVRVRVIDRGPYAAGRTFDLTSAVKRRLGFPDIGTVWSSR